MSTRLKTLMRRFWRIAAALLLLLTIVGASLWLLIVRNNRVPDIAILTPALPNPNGWDDFVAAIALTKNMTHSNPLTRAGASGQTPTKEDFRLAAHDAAPALSRMRQGLTRPYLFPPVRSHNATTFTQFAGLRQLARVNAAAGEYERLCGHDARAADILLDGAEMGAVLPTGGDMIVLLVGIALEAINLSRLEALLPHLTAGELAHVAQRLESVVARRASLADVLLEESTEETASLLEAWRDPTNPKENPASWQGALTLAQAQDVDDTEDQTDKGYTWKQRMAAAKYLVSDKTTMIRENQRYIQAVATEARQPYLGDSRVKVLDNLLMSWYATFSASRRVVTTTEADYALLQTEVALLRYHAEKRRYPQSLMALVPHWLKAAPLDPFGGYARPILRYQLTQKGQAFLLYSVGPNQRDDQGSLPSSNANDDGDLVAGHLWLGKHR